MTAAVLLVGCADTDTTGGCDRPEMPEPSAVAGAVLPHELRPSEKPPGLEDDEIEAALPLPANDASFDERMLNALQRKTLGMVGKLGRTSPGRCDDHEATQSAGPTILRCTVTYEGVEVPWMVEITGSDGLSYEYATKPLTSVHTAQSLYDQYAWHVGKTAGKDAVDPRCDEVPQVFAAAPGQPTDYHCQDISGSCGNGDWDFQRVSQPARVDEDGHLTFDLPTPAG